MFEKAHEHGVDYQGPNVTEEYEELTALLGEIIEINNQFKAEHPKEEPLSEMEAVPVAKYPVPVPGFSSDGTSPEEVIEMSAGEVKNGGNTK